MQSSNAPSEEFVPMIWGLDEFSDDRNEGRQFSLEHGRIPASATHLLGFNEPGLGSQSNISDPIRVSLLTFIVEGNTAPFGVTHISSAWPHSS